MTKKVVLVGIDGADYQLTKKWLKGKLPNLEKIAKQGARAIFTKLKSTIPPLSPAAWTSIFTGMSPDKHGIYGFTKRSKESYFPRLISSRDRKVDAIWTILSRYEKRSILINIPFTYPPEKINGIMITGLGTPSKDSNFVYPPEFKKKILREFPNYDVDFGEDAIDKNKPNSVLPKIRKVTNAQIELTKKLFLEEEWEFFCSVFRSLDVIQHFFINDEEKILEYYKTLDNVIGWILSNINLENTALVICSDHGFGYSHTNFNVNAWLKQKEYLNIRHKSSIFSKTLPTVEVIRRLLAGNKIGRKIAYDIKKSELNKYVLKFFPSEIDTNKIDWSGTKAYFRYGSFGLININLKGREPKGIVDISDREKIIKSMVDDIKELRDPKTGESPVKNVSSILPEDNEMPDIILQKNRGYCLRSGVMEDIFSKKEEYPGDHDIDGVFLATGAEVQISNANISNVTDITPLVLSILGIRPSQGSLKHRTKVVIKQFRERKKMNKLYGTFI